MTLRRPHVRRLAAVLVLAGCGEGGLAASASRTSVSSDPPSGGADGSTLLIDVDVTPGLEEQIWSSGEAVASVTTSVGARGETQICLVMQFGERGGSACRPADQVSSKFFTVSSTAPADPVENWIMGVVERGVETVSVNDGKAFDVVVPATLPTLGVYVIPIGGTPEEHPHIRGYNAEGEQVLEVKTDT